MAEFVDTNHEFVEDGEFRLGIMGGPFGSSIVQSLTIAERPIQDLAAYDLERTPALAGRFDRPEARALAKMLIFRGFAKRYAPMPFGEAGDNARPGSRPD